MHVLAVQLNIAWEDPPANCRRVEQLLARSGCARGSLVVLPEMFATGFSMNAAAAAEDSGGPAQSFLRTLAMEKGVFVLGGVAVRSGKRHPRNEALALDPRGKELARYAKRHLLSLAGEPRSYEPGEKVITFSCGGLTLAPFICYDLRFPEDFRAAVRRGVDCYAVIANWPRARAAHWRPLLRARAIENQAFVIGVNRCGEDPNHGYAGESVIYAPWGEAIAEAGEAEGVISADLRSEVPRDHRRRFPALKDMRDD